MPAYEYLCDGCGKHFEQRQKMSEPEIEECPDCSGAVKRLISGGTGAIVKGGGPASAATTPCGMPQGSCGGVCGCGH